MKFISHNLPTPVYVNFFGTLEFEYLVPSSDDLMIPSIIHNNNLYYPGHSQREQTSTSNRAVFKGKEKRREEK